MKKHLILAATAVALAGAAAQAADLRMPVKAPVPVAATIYNWTGFYIGVNGGFGGDKDKYPIELGGVSIGDLNLTSSGGFGGGQIGYNYQTGNWVFGLEGDVQGADIRGELTANVGGLASLNAGSKIDFFATARGRVGYAWDRVLLYATGGYAYAHANSFINVAAGGIVAPGFGTGGSVNSDHNGWVAGGGVEYAMTQNLTFKTEYQYLNFERRTLISDGLGDSLSLKPTVHTVRAGLNWKFGY